MALVNFADLDFTQIKGSIQDYLRANSNFTDYDFEGSNLSNIIDVLAYNTYITSYNANMVTNEVFIDRSLFLSLKRFALLQLCTFMQTLREFEDLNYSHFMLPWKSIGRIKPCNANDKICEPFHPMLHWMGDGN